MKKLILAMFVMMFCSTAHAGYQDIVQNQPYVYKFVSGTTVNVVKTLPGILHTITVTGGASSTFEIYDGNPATSTASLPQIASYTATNTAETYTFDIGFSSGCTILNSGAAKYTVSYL